MTIDYIKQWLKIKYKNFKNHLLCRCRKYGKELDYYKNYAFIFFAADYNNLGDIAITIAQRCFLEDCLTDYEIIEVTIEDTYAAINAIKRLKLDNVIVTLIGGGNNGTLYEFIEEPRRCVLKELKDYNIVSFPQSAVYENTDRGRPYLEEFQRLCMKCSNLTLVARERLSYDFYKKNVKANVLLTPDTVFYINGIVQNEKEREDYAALILRNDKEKLICNHIEDDIISALKKNRIKVKEMDTCAIDINDDRKEIFSNYLSVLAKTQFAITDRLHGMILCFISNTPCYVLNINNPKIESTYYTWIGDGCSIKFFKDQTSQEIDLNTYCILDNSQRNAAIENQNKAFYELKAIISRLSQRG